MYIFKNNRHSKKFISGLTVCYILIFSFCVTLAQQKCLTFENILNLLNKKVDQKDIIKQIIQYKVEFELDRQKTTKLARVGASDELLDVIEKNLKKQEELLVITFPRNGEECGANVRVEGRSKIYKNKFLWLFAHLKGLSVWWPQSGVINVDTTNGEWVQRARLGQPEDVGFDFEIKVMWVEESVHRRMKDYLSNGEKTGDFPGIPLPDGYPIAQVKVRKVRH